MIGLYDLKEATKKFEKVEGRASFYERALSIAKEHPVEAAIIILATWNVNRFRMKFNNPDNLIKLEYAIKESEVSFKLLEKYDIQTIDFKSEAGVIKEIYRSLSSIPGVEHTGGSKVMSLMQPKLFVMWDSYIRKHYGILKDDPAAYVQFLVDMQNEVKDVGWEHESKTLAKVIDEYNYVNYTLPELEKKRHERTKT